MWITTWDYVALGMCGFLDKCQPTINKIFEWKMCTQAVCCKVLTAEHIKPLTLLVRSWRNTQLLVVSTPHKRDPSVKHLTSWNVLPGSHEQDAQVSVSNFVFSGSSHFFSYIRSHFERYLHVRLVTLIYSNFKEGSLT